MLVTVTVRPIATVDNAIAASESIEKLELEEGLMMIRLGGKIVRSVSLGSEVIGQLL